jgi:hypothetical protein
MSFTCSPIYVTERDAHTDWTGEWVDSTAGLDALKNTKTRP